MPGQNIYPDADNYPAPSFPQPIPPPEVDPDEGDLLYVAYNPAWTEVLLGAAEQLMLPSTWDGDHDAKILALNRAETLRFLLQQPVAPMEETVPTPYWDNPEDVDDEAPADEQVWYGRMEGTTFVEDVSIWVITGFIAYSGNIGGAIAFKTFAPRFVLAWKQDGIAGAVRVFIDGVDNGLLDTNSDTPGVIEQDYVGDPEIEEHDILMVLESLPA